MSVAEFTTANPSGARRPFLDPCPWTLDLGPGASTLGIFVSYFGWTCVVLGSTLGHLGQSWGNIGAILDALGATWAFLGAMLSHHGAILGLAWDNLGFTWVLLGSMVTLLKCKNRSRSAPVQRNRLHLNTQVQP